MPTYKLITTSTQFVYGSPQQIHNLITDLPQWESVTELTQVDDLDIPQDVTPLSLGWQEILNNGGESPEAWGKLAKAQLDRLGVDLAVTPVSEDEAESYNGDRYERLMWLGSSSLKLLFRSVDLVICLNRLTLEDVASDELWDYLFSLALGHDHCYLPTCRR